jgi:hypothetical protein
MKARANHSRCRHCHRAFVPDYRNRDRQRYCQGDECRKASKRASQRRWWSKPENRDYFRGADRVDHVQDWRIEHPGYWPPRGRRPACTLQEDCSSRVSSQAAYHQELEAAGEEEGCDALQDVCRAQVPLLVGLIAQMRSTLQGDIVGCMRQLIKQGQEILGQVSGARTDERYETG